jgi:hypothetical protein
MISEKTLNGWITFRMTLFNLLVSGSILSSFNLQTFYTTIVLVISSYMRPICMFYSWCGWIYEASHPEVIIALIEACYLARHEENLYLEEETYRMLIDIMRSPELFKSLTGSNLKGITDPHLDHVSEKKKRRLLHLDELEQRGYNIDALRKKELNGEELNKYLL